MDLQGKDVGSRVTVRPSGPALTSVALRANRQQRAVFGTDQDAWASHSRLRNWGDQISGRGIYGGSRRERGTRKESCLRRRDRNIFEVSDEAWVQEEVLRADPSDLRLDSVSGESEQRSSEEGGSVGERYRPQVSRPTLGCEGVQPSGRQTLLLGSALIAGMLVIGAGVLSPGAAERPWSETMVERRAPGLHHQVPATPAERNAGRPAEGGAGRARSGATPSSAGPKPRPLRAGSTSGGPAPSLPAQQGTPTRVAQSAEQPAPGHEFSFER
jgi:hypothetical protein